MDSVKLNQIAQNIVSYSLELKAGENVLIRSYIEAKPLIKEIIKECGLKQVNCSYEIVDDELDKDCIINNDLDFYTLKGQLEQAMYEKYDAVVVIRTRNEVELSGAKDKLARAQANLMNGGRHYYIDNLRWVLISYPTPIMAYQFNMTLEELENFWLDTCSIDYAQMTKDLQPLKALMEQTDQVRVVGPKTDLTFSIKNIPAIICAGKVNLPDGEVYTAPVKDSVCGTIQYNMPSPCMGAMHEDVHLTIENGKIIGYSSKQTSLLDPIFNLDEGARYFGEFAIGVHKNILSPVGLILFDEKIHGSIHFTPGNCYEDASNGNKSGLHWDLVLSQRPEHGGGQIYFDGVLVRDNGLFVLDSLKHLN